MKKLSYLVAIPLGMATLGTAWGQFSPITLTVDNYNYDLIAEKTGPTPLIPGGTIGAPTTASMDGGIANSGNTWNEQGYFTQDESVGLPAAGTSISTNNHQFTLAPSYTANNGIMLDVSYFTNASWRLSTPAPYAALSFLTSGGNGGCVFSITVQREDGTTATGEAASPDWFSVPNNIGWVANGRVDAQSFALNNYNSQNPRLYMVDVSLAASSSPITNIAIAYKSGNASGHSVIMAISGAATAGGAFTPILGSGYNADVVVEAAAAERWNLAGVTAPTTGSMDGGTANTGWSWFEQGYYAPSNTFGLPAPGQIITAETAADHQFRMPPAYDQANAILLTAADIPTHTVTLATPGAYSGLSLLGASGGGSTSVEVVLHHQDGTVKTNLVGVPDWFNNSAVAWTSYGRINVEGGYFGNINTSNPRLYYIDMVVGNSASPITSIDFNFMSTANRAAIFAISGTAGGVKPTIVQQPVAVKTNMGATVSFSVTADGTAPLQYEWQKGTNNVFVGLNVSTPQLLLNNVQMADDAQYRVVVYNTSGATTSDVVALTILSPLNDITQPTDAVAVYQPVGGSYPGGEPPANVINNNTTKYLNFGGNGGSPFKGPVGVIVTPGVGRTIVSGLRFYAANDAVERDPADYTLEGSNDGGSTWVVISSGALSLPDTRNAAALDLDPIAQAIQQVLFANANAYSAYRLSFATVKTASANAMQIGEVEFLGVVDTSGFPAFTTQPQSARVFAGTAVQFTAAANGTPAPTYQWRKGVNGVFTDIAGATSATLNIAAASLADVGQYYVVASNSVGVIPSATVDLVVVSTLEDVTDPADVITGFGDESGTTWGDATNAFNAIDNTVTKWVNGGSGFSAAAGFPPFKGPVGLIVTPAKGPTVVTGLRIFTADGNTERDPADFTLEGSTDDGASYHVIVSGALDLPDTRSSTTTQTDPLQAAMQELIFGNSGAYSSYRITFNNTVNNGSASALQIAEIELLGVAATSVSPALTVGRTSTGAITITSSMPGVLESTTSLVDQNTVWTNEGNISGTVTITPAADVPVKFYRVRLP